MREENEKAEAEVFTHILWKAMAQIELQFENPSSANTHTFTILKAE